MTAEGVIARRTEAIERERSLARMLRGRGSYCEPPWGGGILHDRPSTPYNGEIARHGRRKNNAGAESASRPYEGTANRHRLHKYTTVVEGGVLQAGR
jgi:hypothetical protein